MRNSRSRSKTLTFGTQRYSYKSSHVGKRASKERGYRPEGRYQYCYQVWTCVVCIVQRLSNHLKEEGGRRNGKEKRNKTSREKVIMYYRHRLVSPPHARASTYIIYTNHTHPPAVENTMIPSIRPLSAIRNPSFHHHHIIVAATSSSIDLAAV